MKDKKDKERWEENKRHDEIVRQNEIQRQTREMDYLNHKQTQNNNPLFPFL